ncbi:MAG: zinc ribbon domain-containing protein [Anaerolineales bacterium]|nr:MAG: zinc ribbon domain-containing protein [Anaerolineales bacterium]
MFCPNCGQQNGSEARFCMLCGKPMPNPSSAIPAKRACSHCGYVNRGGIQFCEECGEVLSAGTIDGNNAAAIPSDLLHTRFDRKPQRNLIKSLWSLVLITVLSVLGGWFLGQGLLWVNSSIAPALFVEEVNETDAIHLATDFAVRQYPDINLDLRTVESATYQGRPVYVVDFICDKPPTAIRILVNVLDGGVTLFQYVSGP